MNICIRYEYEYFVWIILILSINVHMYILFIYIHLQMHIAIIYSEINLRIPQSILNGDETERYCGNLNFSFSHVEGESLLMVRRCWVGM